MRSVARTSDIGTGANSPRRDVMLCWPAATLCPDAEAPRAVLPAEASAPLGATPSGDDPPLIDRPALALARPMSSPVSASAGGRFALPHRFHRRTGGPLSGYQRSTLPVARSDVATGCSFRCPSELWRLSLHVCLASPHLTRFYRVHPVGFPFDPATIAGLRPGWRRSSGTVWHALLGTNESVHPASSQVKQYF
jgi:hypothetical protein